MMRLSLLGSTGSIGTQTLDVVRAHPDRLSVAALTAGRNAGLLVAQAREFSPEVVVIRDVGAAGHVRAALPSSVEVRCGAEAVQRAAERDGVGTVVVAITGVAALAPTLSAIRAGKRVAFAAKEPLVAAGELLVAEACERGVPLLPIDSEISALFQCLRGERTEEVARLLLTASGGPFRRSTRAEIEQATVEQALAHPTWSMGAKITIDSASMMNKGLEVIEAQRLFGVPLDRISILVHPQSVIHSMVEFADGSVKAQLACPDMRLPIQYAVLYPERLGNPFDRLDFLPSGRLDFEEADPERFPCIALAYEAARQGGTMTTVLNAANEVAVGAFLGGQIGFGGIPRLIERAMAEHEVVQRPDLVAIMDADARARQCVSRTISSTGA